ncbi:zinc finger protein 184-like [Episyrphus balteatus]|uniref:zinc finger protein 184-like n=1 Tax=Episyrphus balteatus TaxID=286459 RepID=UPI0024853F72|nr:zinc finger protein 184-like [Episyrphus balteatus]
MMINTVLEHVPIKLENFNDDEENSSSNSNDNCSNSIWRPSSSTETELQQTTIISRTSSTTATTLDLDDVIESCGNVFIYSRRKLFLICGFCDSKYANMLQFAKHLNDCHKIFYTHCEEIVVEQSGEGVAANSPPADNDSDSDATIASSTSSTNSGVIVKGGFQIRFVGEGPPPVEKDEESLPTSSDVLLRHVPIKIEEEQPPEEDDKSMMDFENNIESCGNIFVMNRRKLFLICGFCEGKYANMELFASHLHEMHSIFEEDDEVNRSLVGIAPQPLQIKEEPEEVLVAVKRRPTANENLLPMVAIPTVGNEDIVPVLNPEPETVPTAKKKRVLLESRNERISSKDSDDLSVESDFSEVIPPNEEAIILRGIKSFSCQTCSKTFKKLSRMLEHVRIHTGEKPHQCDECGKRFRIKLRLTEHTMRHRNVKAFKCDLCGLGCATRQDFALHQRHHNKDKRYACKECGKGFVRNQDLKTHMRIHTDERPFKCDICNNAFRAKQNLIIHRRKHDATKEFKCDFCEKRFIRKIDRKVHHRTHTGEKAFKCEICNRGYSAKIHVRNHIQKSHMGVAQLEDQSDQGEKIDCQTKEKRTRKSKDKSFKCKHCPKVYTGKSFLEKHMKNVHSDKNEAETTKSDDDILMVEESIDDESPEIIIDDP